ncbi:pilus assembly protein [Actinoplanes sp. G11-F43]|uniref:pilus assembly protein n=1 Tax=Actinoplanes sp. G11-F43 TaxID=3424130 RepID=UPI003D33BCB1
MTVTPADSPRRKRADDRGSIAAELALAVPLLVLLIFLLVGAFNMGRANIDVHTAAGAASRAASLARTSTGATTAAHASATANLGDDCARVSVSVDNGNFRPGGTVTVSVACFVPTRGLSRVGLPSTVTITSSSTSPIDRYRADT